MGIYCKNGQTGCSIHNYRIDALKLLKNKIQAEQFYSKSSVINKKTLDITIENDVWIGRGATILPGVNIGNGAVIGAMSVVAKNVPPYAIAVGNPCKIIKYRFTADQIAKLLLIQWWLFDDEKIVAIADRLQSNNIDKFIEEFT